MRAEVRCTRELGACHLPVASREPFARLSFCVIVFGKTDNDSQHGARAAMPDETTGSRRFPHMPGA